jgi:hypothetical protein
MLDTAQCITAGHIHQEILCRKGHLSELCLRYEAKSISSGVGFGFLQGELSHILCQHEDKFR